MRFHQPISLTIWLTLFIAVATVNAAVIQRLFKRQVVPNPDPNVQSGTSDTENTYIRSDLVSDSTNPTPSSADLIPKDLAAIPVVPSADPNTQPVKVEIVPPPGLPPSSPPTNPMSSPLPPLPDPNLGPPAPGPLLEIEPNPNPNPNPPGAMPLPAPAPNPEIVPPPPPAPAPPAPAPPAPAPAPPAPAPPAPAPPAPAPQPII